MPKIVCLYSQGFICLSLWQTRGRKETKPGNSGYDLSHQVSTDLQGEHKLNTSVSN